jgi:hypothetical protein
MIYRRQNVCTHTVNNSHKVLDSTCIIVFNDRTVRPLIADHLFNEYMYSLACERTELFINDP